MSDDEKLGLGLVSGNWWSSGRQCTCNACPIKGSSLHNWRIWLCFLSFPGSLCCVVTILRYWWYHLGSSGPFPLFKKHKCHLVKWVHNVSSNHFKYLNVSSSEITCAKSSSKLLFGFHLFTNDYLPILEKPCFLTCFQVKHFCKDLKYTGMIEEETGDLPVEKISIWCQQNRRQRVVRAAPLVLLVIPGADASLSSIKATLIILGMYREEQQNILKP